IQRLVEAGAEIVALRRGASGAIVHRADIGETWSIPAVETTVVDPTGAGNAFCGGLLAGWVQSGNLLTAGLYGAVSASFLVEQVGLPESSEAARLRRGEEARRRLTWVQAKAYRL
ncbi:MAG TPA: PfkB family carbohydrate kinase, partial [Anaerolineae bacterium]|nr:PfkB family carbohydrate kinase [Anaerolineae bacterium]